MFDVILVTILLFEYGLSDDTICVPGGPNIGYTSPKGDLYLLPNGDLVVNCTLNKPEYDSADIFWKIATVETNASYVSVLDNRTAQLQLPHSQYPSNFFPATCWIRDRKGSVCHNIVHVGDLPASNITINCTSYDFKRIYCEWDLKKENEINSNWEFQHLNKYKVTEECCNTTKKLMLNCSCEKDEFCHDWEQVFTLKGQNALGTGTTSYTFDQRRNVILSPPDGVNAIDIGNTSATILWDKSYDCTSHLINQTDSNMTIEINLTIKWNNKEQESKTLNFANETYLLTNLIPFSDYEVEIRRRVVVESFKNPYGPRKRVSFRTHPGVPTKSPENLIGSLSEDENTDTVNLTLYWKGIPKEFQGANKFKYIIYISFTGISGTMERRTTNTTTFFLSLSKNASYTFRVKGENEVGETNEESKYSLDSEADYGEDLNSLDVQDVIYDNETQKYIVSWKTSRNQTSSWFRLYWCLGNRTPDGTIFCNAAGINSKEIKGTNVTLSQPYNENCFFGVAAEKPSKFGGLQWSACVIPTNRSPTSPAVLKVLSKGTTWVHLTWKQLPCEEKFVGGYELRIIDIRNSSEIKTVIEGVDANKYNVTGLSPGSTYKFEIRSKTHKEVSEAIASERITTDTDDSGSNDTDEDETGHLVVWIVVPVVCIIVVVTGIAFCKYKSFRDQVKKIIIHVPPRLMEGHPAPLLHTSNINSTPSKQNSRDDWNSREYNAQHTNNSSMQPPSTGLIGSSQDESSEDSGVDATSPLSEDYERMLQDQQSPRGPIHGYSVVATPYLQPSILQGPEPREIPQTYYVVGTGERLPIHRSPSMGIASSLVRNQVPGYTKVVSFATPELTNSRRNRDAHHFPYVPHSSDVESEMGHVLVERENRFPVPDVGEPELTFTNGPGYAQLSVAMDKSSTLQASPSQHASDEMSTSAELSLNVLGNNGCRNITRVTESAELAEASPCQHKTDCVCSKNNHKPYTATQLQPSAADAFQANSVSGYKGIKESSLQSDDSAFQTPSTNSMVGIRESLPLNLSPRMGVRSSIIRNRGPQYTKVSPLTIPKLSSHD